MDRVGFGVAVHSGEARFDRVVTATDGHELRSVGPL